MTINPLTPIFCSQVRAEFLRLFFGLGHPETHLREIERQTGLAIGTIQQEARQLLALELLRSRRDGNRLYFTANTEHPLYPELHRLVLKTTGLIPALKAALSVSGVQCAFIFGSFARGEEKAGSDVDIFVVGSVGLRKITALLSYARKTFDREISVHSFSMQELKKRVAQQEHFVTRVLDEAKIFLVGNEDELRAVRRSIF